ncbi:MAG: leucine-rich repeat protein [Clostridia bacterium]|nr:leucine-rich repeat protein [Clostridia bacterium]
MKSYLKLLMAIVLILSCIAVFASCGEDKAPDTSDKDNMPEIVIPPETSEEETYLVQFVYRYYLTYINDYDRMESKPFTERKVTLEIPVENEGFTEENLREIAGIKHNGYSFADWYLGWDEDNYQVTGDAFDFVNGNAPITSDLTFYGYRGNLAGATATWEIAVEGEGKQQETVLYINGTGATFDYEAVTNIDIPWYEQRAKITKIVIADGITSIGANTFNGLYAADTIVFPDSLESVGTSSFRGMTKLTSLETPKNLKVIGSNAFAETSIKNIVFNEGLEEIGETAFNESNKIVSIIIPSTLKKVKGAAFHPGSVDGKVNASALKYVYSLGTEEDFAKVEIGLDNAWFNELASVYFKPAEGVDPAEVEGPYWDFYSYVDGEGATVVTDTPVPYYYMIKYYLNQSVYGLLTPIYVDYVKTEAALQEDGSLKVTGKVDESHVEFADNIVYHNFKFVRFTNAVTNGLVLTDDRKVTCEVYVGNRISPSATATGSNKGYLSNKGGIVWEFSFATRTLTISLGAETATVENVSALLAKLKADYKGEITAETLISEIFGIKSAEAIKAITDAVGFTSVEEFSALAGKLAALEISSSKDPLIATAEALAAAEVLTAEDLAALVAAIDAEGAAADEALQAKLVILAGYSLDTQNLKDLNAKVSAAGIEGNLVTEFTSLKAYLEAFEANDVLITDIHADMIARSDAMKAIADAAAKSYMVGDAAAFDAAATVSDLVSAISDLQDSEGLFNIWDYETYEDTSVMWASSRSYTSYVEKIVVGEGVKHIGSYTFASLPKIAEITLPESLESIDVTAFDGCSNINSIYCAGTSLADIEVRDAKKGTVAGDLTVDRILQGNYANVFGYTEAATAETGKYWTKVGDSKIAWALDETGHLKIGGPSVMVDFATAEDAPWYGAKDSITKATIFGHISSVGENILNGYANVTALNIGEGYGAIRSIPATAFAGTGIVNDHSKYDADGMLIVNDYLIGYIGDAEFVQIPFYTVSVAEGVLDNNANLKYVYVPSTIIGLHKNVFVNNVPTIIYFEGGSFEWGNVAGNVVFPEGAEYYVALTNRTAEDNPDFFFLYKQEGTNFILLDGCIHIYTEWTETKAPTCLVDGSRERSCTGKCGKTFTEAVPALGHDWTDWSACVDAPTYEERYCQNPDCDGVCSVEGCTVHADHTDDCADDCTAHVNAAHQKVMINSEYTFEGIEAVQDNQIKLSDTTNSKYTIVEIGTDSHAFEYEKLAKDTNAEFTVFATQAGTLSTAKVITYKSDLKIDNTNKKVSIDLVFRSEADPTVKAMVLNILATDGKSLDIGSKSGYGADAVVGDYVSLGVETGKWFNLKVEYYTDGTVAVAKVYVNEKLVYITDVFYGSEADAAAPVSAAVADSVSFVPASNYLGKISLDNVTLTQAADYEFDGETTLIKPITFDEVPPASLVKVDGTAVIVTKDDAKYYSITSRVGDSSTGYYTFYPASKAESANVAIFETDLQITRTAGSRAWAIRFRGGPSSTAYMLEFRHDANTEILYVADKSHSSDSIGYKSEYIQPKDADGNLAEIKVGDWVNVRVEYYEAKVGDAESVRMLTYVNGVLVLYSNNWYGVSTEQETGSAGTVPHPATIDEITDAYIQPYTSHRGEWNVDNTLFYTTYKAAPTDPVTLKYDDYDGKSIDNSGVIRTDWVQEDDRANALKNLTNVEAPSDEEDDNFVPDAPDAPAFGAPITFDDLEALPANVTTTKGTISLGVEGTNKYATALDTARPVITLTEDKLDDATSAVFEATIRFNTTSTGSNAFNFFMTKESTSDRAFELQFKEVDGKFVIYTVSSGLGQADFTTDTTPTDIVKNEWFQLRYEYNESGKAIISIDGKVVLETENYYNKTTENIITSELIPAEDIYGIWVVSFGSNLGNFDFDNIAMYHVAENATEKPHEHEFVDGKCECGAEDPDYVPDAPVQIPVGALTFDAATGFPVSGQTVNVANESQVSASQYTDNNGTPDDTSDDKQVTVYKADGTTPIPQWKGNISFVDGYMRVEDVSADGKTAAQSTSAEIASSADLGQFIMRFNFVETAEGSVAYFQMRLRFSPLEDGKKNYSTTGSAMDFRLNSTGNKNAMAAYLFVDGDKVAFADKSNSSAKVLTTAGEGEWFTLTFVYTYDEATQTSKGTVVVTDKTGVETTADVTTNNAPVADLYRTSIIGNKPFQGIMDIDNVFFGSEIVYPVEKEEVLPEGSLSFDDIEPKTYEAPLTSGSDLGLAGGNITAIYQTAQTNAIVSSAIVAEGKDKYLSISKTYETGSSSQSWINIVVDNSSLADLTTVVFETKMKLNITSVGSGYRLRMYTPKDGTSRTQSSGGTEVAGYVFNSVSGFAPYGKKDLTTELGVEADTWFTMRIEISDYTDDATANFVVYILDEATGEFVSKFTHVNSAITDVSAIDCICFMDSTTTKVDAGFSYFYYGGEPVYPTPEDPDAPVEEEEPEYLEGTVTFDDYEAKEWTIDKTSSVVIAHVNLGQGSTSNMIVSDGDNKYLSLKKTQGGTYVDGQPGWQTAMVFERTMDVPEGTAMVFEADWRLTWPKGNSTYLRLYTGMNADACLTAGNLTSGGTKLLGSNTTSVASTHRNIMFYPTNGSVVIDNGKTENGFAAISVAPVGEWFTMRLVLLDGYITVFVKDENGVFQNLGQINRTGFENFNQINGIAFLNDSEPTVNLDIDNVYFGPYVPDVESPIVNLPEKEESLEAGTVTFNDVEAAALPENISYVFAGDSTLGAVAVTRANKVLAFDKNAGDATFYFNSIKKTVGANTLGFATQMYFDKVDAAGYVDYTLMPSGAAEGDRVYKVRVSVDADGAIKVAPVVLTDGADVVGTAVDTGVKVGEWFKLAIAYTEADSKFVVSVNGEALITSDAPYAMYKDASAISQIAVSASSELVADIYFENMCLAQIIAE